MIHMLTLTCRQSLGFPSISTTIAHSNVHCSFYCNISIIQYCQLNLYVHVCTCASMLVYMYSFFVCACVSRCYIWGGLGMKEKVRNCMVRVHVGCISIRGLVFRSKKFISLLDLFFPTYEKQSWTSSGPCVLKHTAIKSYLLLQHSPFHCEHVSSSGFQTTRQRAGNLKWHTVH